MSEQQSIDITELAFLEGMFPIRLMQLGFRLLQVIDEAGRDQYRYVAPPVCDVPAGPFLMGSDKQRDPDAKDNELPQHEIDLPSFQIGAYPVTVLEYACFVQATNHAAPEDWSNQQQHANHPVVSVSWLDALDYARWLAQMTGEPWRLPTEAEWEKAARGVDGRIFPYGDQWDNMQADTLPYTPTPVGTYANNVSPYGAYDMAGNVWEWTSTIFDEQQFPYPYQSDDGRENDADTTSYRVLRGGSWLNAPQYVRTAFRYSYQPDYFDDSVGMRLGVSVAAGTR